MALSPKEIHELKYFATEIRLNTLETLNHLGFGHYGGSLSVVEILAVLYGKCDGHDIQSNLRRKIEITLSYLKDMQVPLYIVHFIKRIF